MLNFEIFTSEKIFKIIARIDEKVYKIVYLVAMNYSNICPQFSFYAKNICYTV